MMATTGWAIPNGKRRTFGAEFELADWDQHRKPPWRTDMDWTMVNSNGIAVDPKGIVYHYGGEVLANPAERPMGVANQLADFIKKCPETTVNYRSNLHVHVRVPGLRDDLKKLKRIQLYCYHWLPKMLPLIEPIPVPRRGDYDDAGYKGAMKRYARRKVSHQKVMPERTVNLQLAAKTPQQFFEAEALHEPTGVLYWATKPRCAVNLRQLMQTDTIEFRHFPGTINPFEVTTAVEWCDEFIHMALDDVDPVKEYRRNWANRPWPKFKPYVHWMEEFYRVTNPHYVGVEKARENIAKLLG